MSRFAMSKFATAEQRSEAMGYDCGLNMPNTENCHFSAFGSPEQTRAWERGKRRGDREREAAIDQKIEPSNVGEQK